MDQEELVYSSCLDLDDSELDTSRQVRLNLPLAMPACAHVLVLTPPPLPRPAATSASTKG